MGWAPHSSIKARLEHWKRRTIPAFAARFARDERGVTAVIFGIMFTFLFLVAAVAVDYSRASKEIMEQQQALDAAVLAASNDLGLPDQDTAGQARAVKFFEANMPPGTTAHITVALDDDAGEVTGTAQNAMPTTLFRSRVLGQARRDQINLGTSARVVKGNGTIEVALVVDNSGSMAGTKIAALKSAATNLVSVVFTGAEGTDKVKVGVVPFASSVNVGAIHADDAWMDSEAASSIHSENFIQTKSRFDLFSDLGENWGGCVEVRPAPYDLTDAVPSTSFPDTKFVPMFSPDEPDDANADAANVSHYPNNYISDYGGTCPVPTQVCLVFNKKKNKCTSYGPAPLPVADAQERVCKYSGATPGADSGPNYSCTTPAILPLTQTKTTVDDAITALVASGNTNIGEGTMWGWRVLSPSAPFTDGRAYSDSENKKILVIMTDGDNTYSSASNHNKSRYGAFGYGAKHRLGTTYTSTAYAETMDAKLTTSCTNAKAMHITVYTVAFGTGVSPETLALLNSCATDPDHAFIAASGNALIQAFENIGKDIARLRIAG